MDNLNFLNLLEKLNNKYIEMDNPFNNPEVLISPIIAAEKLSKDLTLPLRVKGVFLFSGRPKEKYYSIEELKKSVNNPENNSFPLMLDHKDNEVGQIIGLVDNISYDNNIKGLKWFGHINSETFARNVFDGSIKYVSATVFSEPVYTTEHGLTGTELTFKELSLVLEAAVEGAYITIA